MGVLALGPFLHAHYGHMQVTGFHVNGLESVTPATHISPPSDQLSFTLSVEPESPAVGVAASLPRFEESESSSDTDPEHLNLVLLGFFNCRLMAFISHPLAWVPLFLEQVLGAFQAGAPPPAQAPPL